MFVFEMQVWRHAGIWASETRLKLCVIMRVTLNIRVYVCHDIYAPVGNCVRMYVNTTEFTITTVSSCEKSIDLKIKK